MRQITDKDARVLQEAGCLSSTETAYWETDQRLVAESTQSPGKMRTVFNHQHLYLESRKELLKG